MCVECFGKSAVDRSSRMRLRSAFTLVEILIVVIILGILSAIVIPQFSNAAVTSRKNSLIGQMKTLRSQILLFKLQHNDTLPNLVLNQWNQFQSTTNLSGAVDATATGIFGPYVLKLPQNPLNSNTTVAAAAAIGVGWIYTASTGTLNATNQTETLAFDENTGVVQ